MRKRVTSHLHQRNWYAVSRLHTFIFIRNHLLCTGIFNDYYIIFFKKLDVRQNPHHARRCIFTKLNEVLLTSALNAPLSTFEPVYRRLPQFFAIKHTLCQNTEYRITGGHNFWKLSATFADD